MARTSTAVQLFITNRTTYARRVVKHRVDHLGGDPSGERVLLTGMVAAEDNQPRTMFSGRFSGGFSGGFSGNSLR